MIEKEIIKAVRFSPDEMRVVQEKMRQLGTSNFSAFMRKMAIDGYAVRLELPELKELVSLLRYSSNNLNQLTRRVHESGRIYDADLEDIHQNQERLWGAAQQILDKLSKYHLRFSRIGHPCRPDAQISAFSPRKHLEYPPSNRIPGATPILAECAV